MCRHDDGGNDNRVDARRRMTSKSRSNRSFSDLLKHDIPILGNVEALLTILGCSASTLAIWILDFLSSVPPVILAVVCACSLALLHLWERSVRRRGEESHREEIERLMLDLESSNRALEDERKNALSTLAKVSEERLNVSEGMLDAEFDMRGKRDSVYLKDRNVLLTDVKNYAEKVVNAAAEQFTACAGATVRACVKYLKPGSPSGNGIDLETATVTTLVRSSNTQPPRRRSSKAVKVSRNTDFLEILVGTDGDNPRGWFYEGNLPKYSKELEALGRSYRNTTERWESFYRGTVVVPICIDSGRLFFVDDGGGSLDILGFLCFDTMDTGVFSDDKEALYYAMAADVAAELYPLLSRLKYYLERYEDNLAKGAGGNA